MDNNPTPDRSVDVSVLDDITATEQQFLTLIEEVAAADALTEGDRHQMSYEIEMLSAELRACVDPTPWL